MAEWKTIETAPSGPMFIGGRWEDGVWIMFLCTAYNPHVENCTVRGVTALSTKNKDINAQFVERWHPLPEPPNG